MQTLYELTGQYKELLEMVNDPDVDEEVLKDTLDGIDGEIEVKADGYAKISKTLESDISALEAEEKRLKVRRQGLENKRKLLLSRLEQAMRETGKLKFKTPLFSFSIAKNGGKQPISVTEDIEQIPKEFLIPQPPKVDNEKVRELLKEKEVEWARLEPRGESLKIK